jgi:hypothetical protein
MVDTLKLCDTKEKEYVAYDVNKLKSEIKDDILKITDIYVSPDSVDDWLNSISKDELVQFKLSTHILKSWKAKVIVGGNSVSIHFSPDKHVFNIYKYKSLTSSLILRIPETPVQCICLGINVIDTRKCSPYSDVFYDIKHMNYSQLSYSPSARKIMHEILELQCMSLASNKRMIKVNTVEMASNLRYLNDQSVNYDLMDTMVKIKAFDEVSRALIEANDKSRIVTLNSIPPHFIRLLESSYLYKCIEYISGKNQDAVELDTNTELQEELKSKFNQFMNTVASMSVIADCYMQTIEGTKQPVIKINPAFLDKLYSIVQS